jgi:hypothetical protein
MSTCLTERQPTTSNGERPGDSSVHFVAAELQRRWPELAESSDAPIELGPALGPRLFLNENIWIVSTFIRLRDRGRPVTIGDCLDPDAINVAAERDAVQGSGPAFIVATQGDRGRLVWADHTLAQSPVMADAPRTSLIDMWPQPGLVGRDPERGSAITRLAYFGYPDNLAAAFRSDAFRRELGKLGVEFILKEQPDTWHDYSDVDLCLAVRDLPWHWVKTKPSTKLVHAWLTGAAGLLGPEPSYQYWGTDGQDYFEVRTPADVLAVVKRLKDDPQLYQQVQQRGFDKGRGHDEQAVCQQWERLLWGPIAEQFEQWRQAGRATWAYRAARRRAQRVTAPVREKLFYWRARGWRKGLVHGVGRRLGWSRAT